MAFWGFPSYPPWPPCPPWCIYQQAMPAPYNTCSSPHWFGTGYHETVPTTFGQLIGSTPPTEFCHTSINNDANNQLQVVDESKVPLEKLQGFSTAPDYEEKKPLIKYLPKGDAANDLKNVTHDYLDTLSKPSSGEQNVPYMKKEVPDESGHPDEFHPENCSSVLQKPCSPFPGSSTEENNGPVVSGSNTQDQAHRIDVIQEPHHILSDAVDSLGEPLNALVTHVHHMPSNRVKFRIETEEVQKMRRHRRQSLIREEPVTDPSDFDHCPEAFDCRSILKHMRKHDNVRKYAGILGFSRPKDLKREIDGILGRIPGKRTSRSPRPTWDSLIDTLHKMKSFIEQAVAGLRRNNEEDLAAELDKGYDNLETSIAKAAKAQEMSRK